MSRLLIPTLFLAVASCRADFIYSTWLGGNGTWHDETRWDPMIVPQSNGINFFGATIGSGQVALEYSAPVEWISIASGAALRVAPYASLYVGSYIENHGTLDIGLSDPRLAARGGITSNGGFTLSGSGVTNILSGAQIGEQWVPAHYTIFDQTVNVENGFIHGGLTLVNARLNATGYLNVTQGVFTSLDWGSSLMAGKGATLTHWPDLINSGQTVANGGGMAFYGSNWNDGTVMALNNGSISMEMPGGHGRIEASTGGLIVLSGGPEDFVTQNQIRVQAGGDIRLLRNGFAKFTMDSVQVDPGGRLLVQRTLDLGNEPFSNGGRLELGPSANIITRHFLNTASGVVETNSAIITSGQLANLGLLNITHSSVVRVLGAGGNLDDCHGGGCTLRNGTFVLDDGGLMEVPVDIVRNEARLELGVGSAIFHAAGGFATGRLSHNAGHLELRDGGSLATESLQFTNDGTLRVNAGGQFGDFSLFEYLQLAGETRVNGALAAANIRVTGGMLGGDGQINGDVTMEGGTLSPGNSPGGLTIYGNLHLRPESRLVLEIGGWDPGQYDRLFVSGNIELGGILELIFLHSFRPTSGGLQVVFGQQIAGAFSSIQASGYRVSQFMTNGMLELQFEQVPEPGTVALAAAGLVLLLRRRLLQ
ncbi:MAG: PEP-CTERM sorting domain-containing protein [Acidobacteria bacterium]|nr:PEP-CTERM sorting domain-containing protein [Acidobacteriota bacterium]